MVIKMIELKSVSKKFGDNILFENLDLEIKDGEFVIFSGASGCGKTTLLNIIGGLEKPDEGHVLIDGTDVSHRRNQIDLYRYKFGFLFQNFALIDNKTVRENLNIFKKTCLNGMSPESALEYVGLSNKMNCPVYELSGGEQQRVALARILIKKCNIILADEPTGSLDKRNASEVLSLLDEMNRSGKTIVLVTHDETIKNSGKRVVELKNEKE